MYNYIMYSIIQIMYNYNYMCIITIIYNYLIKITLISETHQCNYIKYYILSWERENTS